ncbi:hypothetical protein GS966_11205 [Rhodococcus hoagii]|nr:hypothetical protein [Prescottella equi]
MSKGSAVTATGLVGIAAGVVLLLVAGVPPLWPAAFAVVGVGVAAAGIRQARKA